eukprot:jgi/Tetstr1/465822/TSEL_010442.t1
MKVIAKKFRGVWHYGVITSVVTEWVLEIYGGATQWRAVFEDGDTVDLMRSEVVEAMAAAHEHSPVDADGEARLATVPEGDHQSSESEEEGWEGGGGDAAGAGWTSDEEEEEEEAAHLRAWESAAVPGSDTNALTFAVMKCSAHVKSKKFNNSVDSDWQLLHDIMPAGFTWGGMAVPRSHKAMRKFLRVRDTSRYVRHMCPKGCVASFSGAPGKAGGWANLPDQHCPECNADSAVGLDLWRVPGGGGGSGGEEALVLLDGPGIRKVAVLMAPVHMSSANAADLGVDAPELLVAGIHARSQDAPSHMYRRRHPTPAALTTNRHVSFGRRFIRVGAQWQPSSPGQQWAASLVVSCVRAAGIEEDEIDMRKRVTRGRPDAKVRKLMAASSTAQPPGVVKTLTDDKKRKRPVKKRRGP